MLAAATAAGFFRRVKNPTPTGMRIKSNEKQSIPIPAPAGNMPELLMPFTSVLYGIFPVAVTAPKIHKNKPGQPHKITAAMVAIRPVLLLFILISPLNELPQVYRNKKWDASLTCIPLVLTAKFRADRVLQPFDDLVADRGSIGIGHRFV